MNPTNAHSSSPPPSFGPDWLPETATRSELQRQIQYELRDLLSRNSLTQEKLALELELETSASVSRWITGASPLSLPRAVMLDEKKEEFGPPSVGGSFEALVLACRDRPHRRTEPLEYGVFLASPMAAIDGTSYTKQRKEALNVKAAIENYCGQSVYYAGENVTTPGDFESTDLAAEVNFTHLANSRFFVLLATCKVARPTSTWVEAGFAMALRIPSLYLIDSLDHLPYVMRTLNQHVVPTLLPPVRVEALNKEQKPSALIRTQGRDIFERLDQNR